MTEEGTRDGLRDALRTLPRQRAGEDFTARVLAAADAPAAVRSGRPTPRLAAAAALAAATLAGALWIGRPEPGSTPPEPERAAALEAERLRLAAELAELRRLAAEMRETPPVLYVGGDEDVDLVLDLERLAREGEAGSGTRPAAYRDGRLY